MTTEKKVTIEYPCEWQYKIIGTNVNDMNEAIALVFGTVPHVVSPSKSSTAGKYTSLTITTVVISEEERNYLFAQLAQSSAIKIVL